MKRVITFAIALLLLLLFLFADNGSIRATGLGFGNGLAQAAPSNPKALLVVPLGAGRSTCKGGVAASQINAYVTCKNSGSPFTSMGSTHRTDGQTYNVDPRLVVAIGGQESSFGTNGKCATQRFNAWGYGGGWPNCFTFGSWSAGIDKVTWQLNDYIFNRGLTTIAQIGATWCGSGCQDWVPNVSKFYSEQGGNPNTNDLTYTGNVDVFSLSVLDGPTGFKQNVGNGYYIYHDGSGYHMRMTTVAKGTTVHYTGTIAADTGAFSGVTTFEFENQDKYQLSSNNQILTFDITNHGIQDGLDWQLNSGSLFFVVQMDGQPASSSISFGSNPMGLASKNNVELDP